MKAAAVLPREGGRREFAWGLGADIGTGKGARGSGREKQGWVSNERLFINF